MPKLLWVAIEAIGVNCQQPLHGIDQAAPRPLGYQVKMMVHQVPSVDLPVGFLAAFAQLCPRVEADPGRR